MISIEGIMYCTYIPSVNSSYTRKKKLTGYARIAKGELWDSLDNNPKLNSLTIPESYYDLTLGFYLKDGLWKRDLDNCQKLVQDVLSEFYEFNDSWIIADYTYKRLLINSDDQEYIYFKLKESTLDYESLTKDFNKIKNNLEG